MKEVPKLFRNVKEELWNKLHEELTLLRHTHPAYRDDQLLMFMLCQRESVEAKFPLVLEEMSTQQLVDWAAGTLMMSIGRGDFKGTLSGILLSV